MQITPSIYPLNGSIDRIVADERYAFGIKPRKIFYSKEVKIDPAKPIEIEAIDMWGPRRNWIEHSSKSKNFLKRLNSPVGPL